MDLRERFTRVYQQNAWGDSESRSGVGSRRDSDSVTHTLALLADIVPRFEVRSIADVPCGDFNWIGSFLESSGVEYTGYDIVESLVESNRARHPEVDFRVLNVVEEVPAKADLILCKDLFNHLAYRDIIQALRNMKASGARLLLATNNFGFKNRRLGRCVDASRCIDLTKKPLCYSAPLQSDHYMGLWDLTRLERDLNPLARIRYWWKYG